MTLIGLVIFLVLIGVLLYLVSLIPMDDRIRQIIYVLGVLALALWLLRSFVGSGADIRLW